ncbi:hypothetical protein H0H93_001039 [Arthromyces matolae]|nr:hypothetical protein H0H93_001039 [Arthromyces matolae]
MTNPEPPTQRRPAVYQWVDEAEDLERYAPGGYHPVHIDDEINGRYTIVHKLGFGAYATVWLARDQVENRFVAIKFIVASASAESREVRILRHINATGTQDPRRSFIATLLDEFDLEGPNGRHRCLVTEVAGPSVGKVRHEITDAILPAAISRKVASQSAQGLAYLHSCGVVHGDFHAGNILLEIPDFQTWPVDKVYRYFGKPIKEDVERLDGNPITSAAPTYVVIPPNARRLARAMIKRNDCNIKISDFGESFLTTDHEKPFLNTPISLAAPEIFFRDTDSVSEKVDIWSLACFIYQVLGNHQLLESFFNIHDEILVDMVRTFGKFPDRWWSKWEQRDTYFEDDGTFKPNSPDQSGDARHVELKERLADIIRNNEERQKEIDGDLQALELVLGKMLRYEPKERITIEEVVSLLPF